MNRRTAALSLLCLVFYLVIRGVLSVTVLSSFSSITLNLEIDQPDRFYIYYKAGEKTQFTQKRSARSQLINPGESSSASFSLRDRTVRMLRLDPGDKTTRVKLYSMAATGQYGPRIHYDAAQIYAMFEPERSISDYRLEQDHVSFNITGTDPHLLGRMPLKVDNSFIEYFFPIILTLIFYLIIADFRWREFPAIADLSRDLSSTHINYAALDGVRGFAVLLVLLDHSWGIFTGVGTAGVWIFFVLSGFLLTIPFVAKPERAIDPQYMRAYLLRRLLRIIPMFYVYVITFKLLAGDVASDSFRHLLFLQGDGHLWTIQQEMLFYLVLPLITLANYLLFRGRAAWIIASLAILMVSANLLLGKDTLSLYSIDASRPPFVGIFICGMLFSYLYHGIILNADITRLRSRRLRGSISTLSLVTLFVYVLLGTDTLFSNGYYLPQNMPGWFGFIAGLLIISVLATPGTLFSRVLSWTPLRAMGLVGYSFYLLHPVVIALVKLLEDHYLGFRAPPIWQLLATLVIAYLLSAFTYTYIERPFLKRAK